MEASELSEETTKSPAKTSRLFRNPSADITFVSTDNVFFKIQSRYFEATSEGFPVPDSTATEEPVSLPEPAEVLEILFQFIHPPSEYGKYHQPSVIGMKKPLFFAVATAAEKYVVYGAMNMCITRMRYELYSSHPVEVLNHSANHGYPDLADKAAPYTISLMNPLEDTLNGLTDPLVAIKWMKYYGRWLQIPKFANSLLLNATNKNCQALYDIVVKLLHNSTSNLTQNELGQPTRNLCGTYQCDCRTPTKWSELVKAEVAAIPKFSQIS